MKLKIFIALLLCLMLSVPAFSADFRIQNESGNDVNFMILYEKSVIAEGYVSGLFGIDITNGPDMGTFVIILHGVGISGSVFEEVKIEANNRLVIFIDEYSKVHIFPITNI